MWPRPAPLPAASWNFRMARPECLRKGHRHTGTNIFNTRRVQGFVGFPPPPALLRVKRQALRSVVRECKSRDHASMSSWSFGAEPTVRSPPFKNRLNPPERRFRSQGGESLKLQLQDREREDHRALPAPGFSFSGKMAGM